MALRNPTYRLHKPSGRAVVTIDGRDFYLGRFGTPESEAEYDRLVSEWLANGRRLPRATVSDQSVNELLLAYLLWADGYYQQSQEPHSIRLAVRQLKALYGHTIAANFGPLGLKTVREAMIRADLCRNEINKRIRRIVRIFKWAVENELAPPALFQGLKAVAGLRRGRTEARESEPVRPVPDEFIEAVRPQVLPEIWGMIQVQLLTGCRPGEVVAMRGCDLNMSGAVWIYQPKAHKTAHHGHQRTILIGPKAQAVLRPWINDDLHAYLFSPKAAQDSFHASRRLNRKTRIQPSHQRRARTLRPRRAPRDRYSVGSYGRAIARGCVKADALAHKQDASIPVDQVVIPHWHPHQLRHNAGTAIRREFGLDMAQVILGHRVRAATEIYAEPDFRKALDVMAKVG